MKPIETKYARYYIEDGIMYIIFLPGIIISESVAKVMSEDRIRLCEGIFMPVFVDSTGLASIDTLARRHFASAESLKYLSAAGILAESLISKLAGNLYITVDKPQIPVKLFTTKATAVKWLKRFRINKK